MGLKGKMDTENTWSALVEQKIADTIDENFLDRELRRIMVKLGIFPNLKGYDYLMSAIRIAMRDSTVIKNMTGRLYPTIAKEYDTTKGAVERGIRHAIDVATRRERIRTLNAFLDTEVFPESYKPTNAEFISVIALHFVSLYGKKTISFS